FINPISSIITSNNICQKWIENQNFPMTANIDPLNLEAFESDWANTIPTSNEIITLVSIRVKQLPRKWLYPTQSSAVSPCS
ncbi:MAG: hypothetical protein WBZ50_12195, partial [Nitrososphaeraceae archaeon]